METATGWGDMSAEKLAEYLSVHAAKAEDDGRIVASFVMLEAARRLLGLDYWPDLPELNAARPSCPGVS